MTVKNRTRLRLTLIVSVALLLVAGVVIVGGITMVNNNTPEGDSTKVSKTSPKPQGVGSAKILPKSLSGQEAIDALGDKIDVVAARNHMTPEELEELLLRSPSAHVSPNGHIFYRDDFGRSTE